MFVKLLQGLSVPRDRDAVFLSPEASGWSSLLAANKQAVDRLADRSDARKELLEAARWYTVEGLGLDCRVSLGEDIIATGHQAGWHHCGIWVKDLIVHKFAQAVGGGGMHVVIDHDICDTAIVLPKRGRDGGWCFDRVELERKQESLPLECRSVPGPGGIETFIEAVIGAGAGRLCNEVWSECLATADNVTRRFDNIADVIAYMQSVLNAALGLDLLYLPVSKLAESTAFNYFVGSVIKNGSEFAAAYNRAITKRLDERAVRPGRTIRPLEVDRKTGVVELPFWLVLPDGGRTSLYVRRESNGKFGIGASSAEPAGFHLDVGCGGLKEALRYAGCRLRPKAVCLTLFVRLFLADWFVHGVGGARYEYVSDYVLRNYYGIKGLGFGVATATATLPLSGRADGSGEKLAELKQQQRYLRHNPERFIEAALRNREPVKSLIEYKAGLVRKAKDRNLPAEARKSAWGSISQVNEELVRFAEGAVRGLDETVKQLEKQSLSNEVRDYREFFFGLFPREELCKMANLPVFAES